MAACRAAGELKHGPIALIDEQMPVIVMAPFDHIFGGATRPGAALAHELSHASGDRVHVDDALDRGLAVGSVGARESARGPEACFAGHRPQSEVGHARRHSEVNKTRSS